eukprot:jgi/Mesvir1/27096/Mv20781-RA.1
MQFHNLHTVVTHKRSPLSDHMGPLCCQSPHARFKGDTGVLFVTSYSKRRITHDRRILNVQSGARSQSAANETKKRVLVVGAGWGGLAAAHALSKDPSVSITIMDAAPRPGGLAAGWETPAGRELEVGMHGFWKQYHNIFALADELSLPMGETFSQYEEQHQYSGVGLEAAWPVFSGLPRLPAPLGSFVWTRFTRLPLHERATAWPMLFALADFDNSDEAWRRWDKISFREMCRRFGVSRRLYKDAFEPMILSGLFAPGELCSAAAAMSMAYFFILGHQDSFDVRWPKAPIAKKILAPWLQAIEATGNAKFLPGTRIARAHVRPLSSGGSGASASSSDVADGHVAPSIYALETDKGEVHECDAVIFAVSMAGMRRLVMADPQGLGSDEQFAGFSNLRGVDVLAVKMWFDRDVRLPRAANAAFGFEDGMGTTFFDVKRLHGLDQGAPGAVVEMDFYYAGAMCARSDEDIVQRARRHLVRAVPEFINAKVIDSGVVRVREGVSHFFPGSYDWLPGTRAAGLQNAFFAGDWVRDNEHGSWSQEKAMVFGLKVLRTAVHGLRKFNDSVFRNSL